MKILKYLLNLIVSNIIWSIIISIPAAIMGIFTTIKIIKIQVLAQQIPIKWVVLHIITIGICIILLVINIIYCIYKVYVNKKRPSFPKIESDYIIKKSEFELFFRDRANIEQRQSIELQVLKDNFSRIVNTIYWTGDKYLGSKLLKGAEANLRLEENVRSHSPYKVSIIMPEKVKRNDIFSYSMQTVVNDDDESMEPYLSKVIKCQTEELILKLTAPVGLVENVKFLISADQAKELVLEEPDIITHRKVGDYDYYEVKLKNLELLHYYSLTWKFSNNA